MERVGGSEREPCVVRNRRGGVGPYDPAPAGRAAPRDRSRAGHPPRCSVSVASPRLTMTSSNYRVCRAQANQLKPNTKRAPARTSKQAKHNFSPSPSFLTLAILDPPLDPPLNPHTPSPVFARVRQRSCRQLLPNTPGPGPSGWLAAGS
jgi:hypothetical protein